MSADQKFCTYLGDGAYASYDGFHVWLTTGHHERDKADNAVALEPEVLGAFNEWQARLKAVLSTATKPEDIPDRA